MPARIRVTFGQWFTGCYLFAEETSWYRLGNALLVDSSRGASHWLKTREARVRVVVVSRGLGQVREAV